MDLALVWAEISGSSTQLRSSQLENLTKSWSPGPSAGGLGVSLPSWSSPLPSRQQLSLSLPLLQLLQLQVALGALGRDQL